LFFHFLRMLFSFAPAGGLVVHLKTSRFFAVWASLGGTFGNESQGRRSMAAKWFQKAMTASMASTYSSSLSFSICQETPCPPGSIITTPLQRPDRSAAQPLTQTGLRGLRVGIFAPLQQRLRG
jgi:hypothetical protein